MSELGKDSPPQRPASPTPLPSDLRPSPAKAVSTGRIGLTAMRPTVFWRHSVQQRSLELFGASLWYQSRAIS